MSQNDARHGFDFQVLQAFFLFPSEVADLFLREFNVFDIGLRDLRNGHFYLVFGETKLFACEAIKLFREFSHRCIAALLNVRQDMFDDPAHLCVGLSYISVAFSLLQISDHFSFS